MYTTEEAKQISKTIFQQLGGNRFVAMTGSKNFAFDKNGGLSFAFPRSNGVNRCKIELTPEDLYKVTFSIVHGKNFSTKKVYDEVFCDMLEDIFTEATGLYTSL